MTFDEWLATQGLTRNEDSGRVEDYDRSPVDEDMLSQEYERSWLFGEAGKQPDINIGGQQYSQIGGYANNDPDAKKALEIEISYLRGRGINAIEDPRYGWIAPADQVSQAHPAQQESGFDMFLGFIFPLLVQAGMVSGIAGGISAALSEAGKTTGNALVDRIAVKAGTGATVAAGTGQDPLMGAASGAAGEVIGEFFPGDTAVSYPLDANTTGLRQMAIDAGLSGEAVEDFVRSGGTMGSTAAGGGGLIGGVSGASNLMGDAASDVVDQVAVDNASQWMNYTDPWATGDATSVANSGIAGDTSLADPQSMITRVATETPTLQSQANRFLNADTQPPAPVETRTPTPPLSIWDKIWNGVTSDKGMAAAITVGGSVIGGMSTAAYNRETMQDKAALDLQNPQALQQAKTDQSRQNMLKGSIGVRPAATRRPLQRLTGGDVYTSGGLIRRA